MVTNGRLGRGVLAALGFVSAIGPFATDMYLASLPQIASSLDTPAASVQLTLTAFLLGMACGQLLFGPLSDRFGRRRVLVIALGVFAAVSVAIAFSPGIGVLVAGRFVQGVTGSSGVVIARAVVADLTTGSAAMRALSLMSMVSSLGIIIAPLVGGVIATVTDWRGVLLTLGGIATAMFVLALLFIPESLPPSRRLRGGVRTIAAGFAALVRDRAFLAPALTFMFGFAMLMSYISASSFVVQSVLGLGPLAYGAGFTAGAAAMLGGNAVNARLAGRVSSPTMLLIGVGCGLLGGVAMLAQAVLGVLTLAGFIACAIAVTGGTALVMANATTIALGRAGGARGTGSAILGSGQFFLGAAVSPIVGLWGEHTAVPAAVCVSVAALCAAACAIAARRTAS